MRRLGRLALAGALLLACALPPRPALAHAVVVRTDPPDACLAAGLPAGDPGCIAAPLASAPSGVRIWFSEPVTPVAGGLRVLAPSGARVERGPVRAEGDALAVDIAADEQGTYLVTWSAIAADTHPARGGFTFSVGHPGPAPRVAEGAGPLGLATQVLARALHFVGYALGFGVVAARWSVLRPLGLARDAAVERRLRRLTALGVAALLLAEPLALLAQGISLAGPAGLDADVLGDALASSFGRLLGLRLAAALGLWLLLGMLVPGSGAALPSAGSIGLGLALAWSDGLAAHATGVASPGLGLLANLVHVAAMGAWLGALAVLLATWRLPALAARRAAVLARGLRWSGGAVALLVLSGAAMALQHLPAPAVLVTDEYGRALAAKVALLPLALLLGARAARGGRVRWWIAEAAVLAGVLALAALLVAIPPPLGAG